MSILFEIAALVAILSTILVITGRNAVHALLCMILSLLSIAVIFYLVGAPFAAALEVVIYAGAIMVMFIFVIMLLNLGKRADEEEEKDLTLGRWLLPFFLGFVLMSEILYVIFTGAIPVSTFSVIEPKQVSLALYGPYLLGVELASMMLVAGLLGAYHLGRKNGALRNRHGIREQRKNYG